MMETSTFGSVYIAAKAATEMIQDLLYNLYMMGIHIYGSTNMFHDNEAVVGNSTMPESTLKKKLVAVCYCCVQEACALGMIQITKEDGATYLADLLTKSVPGPQLRDSIGQIIY